MQSLKVRGPCGSLDFQTLLVLGPLQKLLLPFIFHGSVPLFVAWFQKIYITDFVNYCFLKVKRVSKIDFFIHKLNQTRKVFKGGTNSKEEVVLFQKSFHPIM